jgi:hypothetical protein
MVGPAVKRDVVAHLRVVMGLPDRRHRSQDGALRVDSVDRCNISLRFALRRLLRRARVCACVKRARRFAV